MWDEHAHGSGLPSGAARLPYDEPLDDVGLLLSELAERRMPLRRSYFVSYFIRFAPEDLRQADDAEPQARAEGWETAQYNDTDGQVLRLSRQGAVSPGRLQADRQSVRRLIREQGGRWEGVVIEELRRRDYWSELADSLMLRAVPRQATTSPASGRKARPVASPSAAAGAR